MHEYNDSEARRNYDTLKSDTTIVFSCMMDINIIREFQYFVKEIQGRRSSSNF